MEYKIMTFNLKNDHHQLTRAKAICHIIEHEDADLIGTQECSYQMVTYFQKHLKNYMILQDSRSKEHEDDNLILVHKGKFEILGSGIYSLSSKENIPGTKNLTSIQPRKLSFVKVKDQKRVFSFYNTHLDFLLTHCKKYQLQVIQKILNQDTIKDKILVGDFNTTTNKYFQKFMIRAGLYDIIPDDSGFSFNSRLFRKPIDHILVNPNIIMKDLYKYNISSNEKVSDHYPILAKVKIN